MDTITYHIYKSITKSKIWLNRFVGKLVPFMYLESLALVEIINAR